MERILQVTSLNPDIYRQDCIRYNLLRLAANHENARIFTDSRHVIVCQTNARTPIWIWTHPDVTREELKALQECLLAHFTWKSYTTVMIKPELASIIEQLIKRQIHVPCKTLASMMAYQWEPSRYPGEKQGYMEQASIPMMELVAEFRARDINEMEHLGVSVTDLKKEATWMIHTGNAFLWRDPQGNVTSLAYVAHRFADQARVNRVYTHPKYRQNGYASMLMHTLAERIYEEGRVAMVYADATYEPANRTYCKSGFIKRGMLLEIGTR